MARKDSGPTRVEVHRELAELINRKPTNGWPNISSRFHLVEPEPGFKLVLQEYKPGIVRRVSPEFVKDVLIQHINESNPRSRTYQMSVKEAMACVAYWMSTTPPIEEPKAIGQKNDNGIFYHRLDFNFNDPITDETPYMDEFLSRTECPNEIMAGVGSMFIPESNRQQYFWMFGDGGDGKGSFAGALVPLFGNSFAPSVAPKNGAQKYWTDTLVGKRFVLFPDCNNYGFINEGIFKAATGDDKVQCEIKGGKIYASYLNCKFWFLSNKQPLIDGSRASLRRAIYTYVRPPTGNYNELNPEVANHMKLEAPTFVRKCIKKYHEICPLHSMIKFQSDSVDLLVDTNEEFYADLTDRYFKVVPNSNVKASRMQEVRRLEKLDQDTYRNWLGYLRRKYQIASCRTVGGKERIYKGIQDLSVVESIVETLERPRPVRVY
jgi:hypothetical protein